MIRIFNQSDTLIIVLHEIYGINQHILDYCEQLSSEGYDIVCPNLLETKVVFDYSKQEEAYQYFQRKIGFQTAQQKVREIVQLNREKYTNLFVVGFSIGATIAWLCSNEQEIAGIVGFYGSRIRDYVKIDPQCPVLLFFSEEEQSFNVEKVMEKIKHPNIELYREEGHHGFCDPYSLYYRNDLAQRTFDKTKAFLLEKIRLPR
ncbi:dienelactone hydrolase family protein [Bacillus spongiae]|uniref:Dienelactone hydrolase family protein n=1 Tax=Bacillus spongiae TaxID=2683610 RepID=A0ABU8HCB3_9BACI